jgi:hypothetical protein
LRAADQDVEALVLDLHPDADLTALNLLAAWAPVAAVAGTPTHGDTAWLQGLAATAFGTPERAMLAARNSVQARRWLGLGLEQSRADGEPLVDGDVVVELHCLAQVNLMPEASLGKVRPLPLAVREVFLPLGVEPTTAPEALEDGLAEWLEDLDGERRAGTPPVLRAARAQVELLRLRPFLRGNRQVGRLVAEGLLLDAGYPPLPLESLWIAHREVLQGQLHKAVTTGDEVAWATWYARSVARAAAVAREAAPALAATRARLTAVLGALRDPDTVSDAQLDRLVEALCRTPVTYVLALARDAGDLRPLTVRLLTCRARRHGDLLPVALGDTLPLAHLAAPDLLDLARRLVSRGRWLDWR